MKKSPKKKKDDEFEKLYMRNWIICIVALGLAVFFMFIFPTLDIPSLNR
jgi:hypothetical protein